MNVTLLLLLLMIFNLNCITKRREVPFDFSIRIEEIPSQPQPGTTGYAMEIRHHGKSTDKKVFELTELQGAQRHVITLNYHDVLRLYHEVMDKKIMKMKEQYTDMSVLDGGTMALLLEMNGKKKRILLRNTTPPQLHNFFTLINKMKQPGK